MRWIYISPHLDDAVLSAGGLIYEQTRAGIPVEIWTCMSGFPPDAEVSSLAQSMHEQWGFASAEETIRLRRLEDDRAASILGAKTFHYDFLDCIYRRSASGDWEYPSGVFDPPHASEADLPKQITRAISARLHADDVLVCQFAIGSHVDHVIVRRAVEGLSLPLFYDCDIPYLFNHPEDFTPNTAGKKETVYAVSEASLGFWQEAVMAYSSQLSMLFESPEHLRKSLRDYWAKKQGISLWQVR